MNSSFGTNISITLFGESHSQEIGVVLQGLAAGLPLDLAFIKHQLWLRQPHGKISSPRQEADEFRISSGYFRGFTTGTPLTIIIPNHAQNSQAYEENKTLLRPGHADFTAYEKYHGFQDYRGGGHFSGRITAALVAAGAICLQILQTKNIKIGSHIAFCGGISDDNFSDYATEIAALNQRLFPTISKKIEAAMKEKILAAAAEQDSLGGILETAVIGMPTGIGEPFFDSVESCLAHLIFSIPAVKGVEFGLGFDFAKTKGSLANDSFCIGEKPNPNSTIVAANKIGNTSHINTPYIIEETAPSGKIPTTIRTKTNHNGGINGGITNGMPILIRTAIKPTPSIFKTQPTVDYATKKNTEITLKGSHDPAIIHRARVVVDSVVAIGLLDLLTARYGREWQNQ